MSEEIYVYRDQSGPASGYLAASEETIAERRAVLDLNEAFIRKHADTLAGSYWRVGYLDPEVEVSFGNYRGKPASAKDIARLWPDADWRIVKDQFQKNVRDYVAVVDGVTIRIRGAERIEPVRLPKDGTKLCLDDAESEVAK